ncbi:hypothetical protein CHLNCDRAFT_55453 [Chlorella variabilis]|uniref:Single-stranded DNA-binding protein n=1 Tax=Chlorella variabilis TaxID=554065 RepID=E1ZTB4_CHLVA|nr:hypothetical protein CHLNCDRAFT_55453 [Chlorella variabilis]EFN50904.1 hypothetical protein CHLNCDRAFT_55453 [Chlorella variabilis]|eukprot:XP_005843006.1 hypothetical protein CHLNCDRAFT_55453 [Chlorella variabilis]
MWRSVAAKMQATVAALSKTGTTHIGPQPVGGRTAVPRLHLPTVGFPGAARSLFGASWAHSGSTGPRGAAAGPVRSYAYDAATEAPAADIGEVDFDPSLANTVRLIGMVGNKRDMRVFERSKLLPFSIGFKTDRRRPEETDWVNVEAWGPLAERADQQLQKGDRVAVQGRLKVDKWEDRATGQKRTAFKLVATSISRVRSTFPPREPGHLGDPAGAGGPQQQQPAAAAAAGQAGPAPWDEPPLWWDNRVGKRNPKAPDFKKKVGGSDAPALWVEGRNTPGWVKAELERLDALGR